MANAVVITGQDIQRAEQYSVQEKPDVRKGTTGRMTFSPTMSSRSNLLTYWGTYERERQLRRWWLDDYNELFRGAIAGIIKRVQSTPWEITADGEWGDYWQRLMQVADFGSWDNFIAKLITDFSVQDVGAFIEIIAPGDPRFAPIGPAVGLAMLDPLYCWPTGDPEYPVIYQSRGKYHIMHRGRVVRFVDMMQSSEDVPDIGLSALSRCIPSVKRDILMNQYIEGKLDDSPPPGIAIFHNISEQQERDYIELRDRQIATDAGNEWGRTVKMYSLDPAFAPDVKYITFAQAPEGWDWDKYINITARKMAAGIGVDIQDFWELTGGGIGTGTQSAVLAAKARGKALGRILRGIERTINMVLPEEAEFAFKYSDAEEDLERATIAVSRSTVVATNAGNMSVDEQRRYMADSDNTYREAVTDEAGNVREYSDVDPKGPDQPAPIAPAPAQPAGPAPGEDDIIVDDVRGLSVETAEKAIGATREEFKRAFVDILGFAQDGTLPRPSIRIALRTQLQQAGRAAYLDGLRDGGLDNPEWSQEMDAILAEWRERQNPYIDAFIDALYNKGAGLAAPMERAQLWVNMSINPMYYRGLEDAAPNQRYEWGLGATQESCVTCLGLNGQVHLLRDYRRLNLVPQSRSLVCGGWRCDCRLTKTDQPSRGRLRGVRYVRGRRGRQIEIKWIQTGEEHHAHSH